MHIQLLPPTLPPRTSLSPEAPRVALTPGQQVTAVVLSPDLEGRSMLAFAGRELASRTPLPFPPGARVLLEVIDVEGGVPQMRVVPDAPAPHPAIAETTYGYAAAVLAARTAADAPHAAAAAEALARWLPLLVARGLLTPRQVQDLEGLSARLVVPRRGPGHGHAASADEAAALAEAIRAHVADAPASLEAALARQLREGHDAVAAATLDTTLRGRLARLRADLEGGREARAATSGVARDALASLDQLEQAWLAEQARMAGHYARDGVLLLRLPLEVDGEEREVTLRVEEDRPGSGEDAPVRSRHRVWLDIELESLGRVQVHLVMTGDDVVAVEFVAERGETGDALDVRLVGLTNALTAAGFRDVLTRVALDPVRATATLPPLDLPPEGSILNTDA